MARKRESAEGDEEIDLGRSRPDRRRRPAKEAAVEAANLEAMTAGALAAGEKTVEERVRSGGRRVVEAGATPADLSRADAAGKKAKDRTRKAKKTATAEVDKVAAEPDEDKEKDKDKDKSEKLPEEFLREVRAEAEGINEEGRRLHFYAMRAVRYFERLGREDAATDIHLVHRAYDQILSDHHRACLEVQNETDLDKAKAKLADGHRRIQSKRLQFNAQLRESSKEVIPPFDPEKDQTEPWSGEEDEPAVTGGAGAPAPVAGASGAPGAPAPEPAAAEVTPAASETENPPRLISPDAFGAEMRGFFRSSVTVRDSACRVMPGENRIQVIFGITDSYQGPGDSSPLGDLDLEVVFGNAGNTIGVVSVDVRNVSNPDIDQDELREAFDSLAQKLPELLWNSFGAGASAPIERMSIGDEGLRVEFVGAAPAPGAPGGEEPPAGGGEPEPEAGAGTGEEEEAAASEEEEAEEEPTTTAAPATAGGAVPGGAPDAGEPDEEEDDENAEEEEPPQGVPPNGPESPEMSQGRRFLEYLKGRREQLPREGEGRLLTALRFAGETWQKIPKKWKWALAGALWAIPAASAAVVGAPVGAIAAAAFIGKGFQRAAGSAAMWVTVEGALQRSKEKQERWWNKHPKWVATGAAALIAFGVPGKMLHFAADHLGVSDWFGEKFWPGGHPPHGGVGGGHHGGGSVGAEHATGAAVEVGVHNTAHVAEEAMQNFGVSHAEWIGISHHTIAQLDASPAPQDAALVKHLYSLGQTAGYPMDKVPTNMTVGEYAAAAAKHAMEHNSQMAHLPSDASVGKVWAAFGKGYEQNYFGGADHNTVAAAAGAAPVEHGATGTPTPSAEHGGASAASGTEAATAGTHEVAAGTSVLEVQPHDNLWSMLDQHMKEAGLTTGMSVEQQHIFLDDIEDHLRALPPEELQKMGFASGNIDVIHAGEKLNLAAILENKTTMQSILEHAGMNHAAAEQAVAHIGHEATAAAPVDASHAVDHGGADHSSTAGAPGEHGTTHASEAAAGSGVAGSEHLAQGHYDPQAGGGPVPAERLAPYIDRNPYLRDWLDQHPGEQISRNDYQELFRLNQLREVIHPESLPKPTMLEHMVSSDPFTHEYSNIQNVTVRDFMHRVPVPGSPDGDPKLWDDVSHGVRSVVLGQGHAAHSVTLSAEHLRLRDYLENIPNVRVLHNLTIDELRRMMQQGG